MGAGQGAMGAALAPPAVTRGPGAAALGMHSGVCSCAPGHIPGIPLSCLAPPRPQLTGSLKVLEYASTQ